MGAPERSMGAPERSVEGGKYFRETARLETRGPEEAGARGVGDGEDMSEAGEECGAGGRHWRIIR